MFGALELDLKFFCTVQDLGLDLKGNQKLNTNMDIFSFNNTQTVVFKQNEFNVAI
jgi:hypothetical protein